MSAPLPLLVSGRIELWQLLPDAPRHWSAMHSPYTHTAYRRDWVKAATEVLGYPVMLDCGDRDEVWVVRASPMPNEPEQKP